MASLYLLGQSNTSLASAAARARLKASDQLSFTLLERDEKALRRALLPATPAAAVDVLAGSQLWHTLRPTTAARPAQTEAPKRRRGEQRVAPRPAAAPASTVQLVTAHDVGIKLVVANCLAFYDLDRVKIGLGRIVALHRRSSTSYQIH
jgi:hypothetical protein